jgi:hypothetical protein
MYLSTVYKSYNAENVSFIPFISGRPTIYTSNAYVMRQISAGGHKSSWIKPEYASVVHMFVLFVDISGI